MRRLSAVLTFGVLIAVACGDKEDLDHPLGRILIDDAPAGHELVGPPATGPMDLDEAATSTEASQTGLRRQLATTGFQSGYARAWKDGRDFTALLVYEFLTHRRATELVGFMAGQIEDKPNAQAFDVPSLPGAKGSILNASNDEGESLFCQLTWFSVEERAFSVRMCSTVPNASEPVIDLTQKQYRKAL